MTNITTWIEAFADRLGTVAPDKERVDAILRLAAVAARGSARQAAPIACWLGAAAGLDPDEAEVLAGEVTERLGIDPSN